jgi:HlyD family secretion protein
VLRAIGSYGIIFFLVRTHLGSRIGVDACRIDALGILVHALMAASETEAAGCLHDKGSEATKAMNECSAERPRPRAHEAVGDRGEGPAPLSVRDTGRRFRLREKTRQTISGRSIDWRAYRMRRLFLPTLIAAVLIAAASYFLFGRGESELTYRLAPVETGPIVSLVSAAGTVELGESVPVAAQAAGEVTELVADYNDQVKTGDVLARLDPAPAAARLDMARADLNVARGAIDIAESQIELARRQLDNARASVESARAAVTAAGLAVSDAERDLTITRRLAATGDAARVEMERAKSTRDRAGTDLAAAKAHETAAVASYDAAQAQLEVSQGQLSNARATLASREIAVRQAEQDVEDTTIRAPVDGVVMARNITDRQQVNAGQVLFTLTEDLRRIELHARIDEADVGRIAPGQSASFGFGAYPGRTFQGQVSDIRKMPQIAEGIVTYVAVIVANNDDLLFLPGMTAEIRVAVNSRDNVVKVPKAALRFVPPVSDTQSGASAGQPAGGETVWMLNGERPQPVPVRTGISDGVYTEIVEGELKPGQQVIVGVAKSDKKQSAGPLRL